MIINITKDNYESEVLKSEKPVLVDFGAPWCVPCKHVGKVVEELSMETDAVKFAYIDIEANPDIAVQNGVMSIPVLIFFKNGKPAGRIAGVKSKAAIQAMINK